MDAHVDFHVLVETLGSLVDGDLRVVEDTALEVSLAACITLQESCIVALLVKSVLESAYIELPVAEGASGKLGVSDFCFLVAEVVRLLDWFLWDQLVAAGKPRGHELLPERIEEDLVLAGEELDAVAVEQLQILEYQIGKHMGLGPLKDALVTLGELEDVLVQELEAVLFAVDEVKEGDEEAVGVLGRTKKRYDEVSATDFTTLLADEMAVAQLGPSGEARMTHIDAHVGR